MKCEILSNKKSLSKIIDFSILYLLSKSISIIGIHLLKFCSISLYHTSRVTFFSFSTISIFNGNINDKQFQKTEVSDMKWLTHKECIDNIRHYNIEKINLINNINDMLNKYRLIS